MPHTHAASATGYPLAVRRGRVCARVGFVESACRYRTDSTLLHDEGTACGKADAFAGSKGEAECPGEDQGRRALVGPGLTMPYPGAFYQVRS